MYKMFIIIPMKQTTRTGGKQKLSPNKEFCIHFCLFTLNYFCYHFLWLLLVFSVSLLVCVCVCGNTSECCHATKFKMKANSRGILAMKSNTQFTQTEALRLLSVEILPHIQRGIEKWRSFTLYITTIDDVFVKEIIGNKFDVQSLYLPKINKQNERIFHISLDFSIHSFTIFVYDTLKTETFFLFIVFTGFVQTCIHIFI